jgi:hypothetical protein
MELLNFVVAEKATVEHFSIDRVMNAIVKSFKTVNKPTVVGDATRFLGKLTMTQYTFEDLGGKIKAQIRDGQRHDMFEVMDLEGDAWDEFLDFRQPYSGCISWEQSAALYWSQKIPDCWLVSESEQVLDFAQSLGVPIMTIEEMQEVFFADEIFDTAIDCPVPPFVVAPFDPRVDAGKVEAAFSEGLDGDLAVLKQKSYWVVVCVLFEWFGWIGQRKRADFCRWVNAHFHFDKPIVAEIDLKSAINKINVKERNLELWPDNQYRDLAYLLQDMFFGERKGLQNGFYVYANEQQFLKPGKMWRRRDW